MIFKLVVMASVAAHKEEMLNQKHKKGIDNKKCIKQKQKSNRLVAV